MKASRVSVTSLALCVSKYCMRAVHHALMLEKQTMLPLPHSKCSIIHSHQSPKPSRFSRPCIAWGSRRYNLQILATYSRQVHHHHHHQTMTDPPLPNNTARVTEHQFDPHKLPPFLFKTKVSQQQKVRSPLFSLLNSGGKRRTLKTLTLIPHHREIRKFSNPLQALSAFAGLPSPATKGVDVRAQFVIWGPPL